MKRLESKWSPAALLLCEKKVDQIFFVWYLSCILAYPERAHNADKHGTFQVWGLEGARSKTIARCHTLKCSFFFLGVLGLVWSGRVNRVGGGSVWAFPPQKKNKKQ